MRTSYTWPIDAILLLGPTGVGKSPLGDTIARSGLFGRRCHHLDFGSELRGAVANHESSRMYTAVEVDIIHGVLERGLLLENEHFPLVRKIISLFLIRAGFSKYDVLVLNGIPRHEGQARDIAKIVRFHFLVVLDCSAADVYCRIRENVGGDRTARLDDYREIIGKKLVIFHERTAPLIHYYETRGSKIYRITVQSTMTPADAFRSLSLLATTDPPVALVAKPPQR
ncbi:MAG TPA: nucleoside monophosphate kinase [Nitrospirota bacterium]|nr:nucleoside monophosphate kinase [Nitrospirota bacterium]